MNSSIKKVLITGGAGYVGAVLVPKLLRRGIAVRVLDLYIFGRDVLNDVKNHPLLEEIQGDIRDTDLMGRSLKGVDAVIHLACISNDPSFELDPALGRSINYDAFGPLVKLAKQNKVRRFIYASSSSVYGVKKEKNVTENLPLEPLTDYSKYKALCETILLNERNSGFATLVLRPATVCGYSPRLRLDLTVNILTHHAVNNRKIKVFGGDQMRPNIHIDDMTDLYLRSLEWPDKSVDGKIYNAGYENHTVQQLAEMVRSAVSKMVPGREQLEIETTPSDDQRSYHISSEKIKRELGFSAKRTIEDAICDLVNAFQAGKLPDSMTDARYYNLRIMKNLELSQALS